MGQGIWGKEHFIQESRHVKGLGGKTGESCGHSRAYTKSFRLKQTGSAVLVPRLFLLNSLRRA